MPGQTLDYIEGIELTEEALADQYEALMVLARLAEGLDWLNGHVDRLERTVSEKARKKDIQYGLVGDILDEQPLSFLSCAFQWYAVSACNYAQLVGWIHTKHPAGAWQYMRRAMPVLVAFRNKVAAHLAITNPRQDDNEADLFASLLTQVVYGKGRLLAGAVTQSVGDGDQKVLASRNLSWSLTSTHRELKRRFWRNGLPTAYQSLRVPANATIDLHIRLPDQP